MLRLPTVRLSLWQSLLVGLPVAALVGLLDHATGPYAMSLLCHAPVVAAGWLSGPLAAGVTAAAAGLSLLVVRPDEAALEAVAARVRTSLDAIASGDPGSGLGASIGFVVQAAPRPDADALLREADAAMYGVETAGKGGHAVVTL